MNAAEISALVAECASRILDHSEPADVEANVCAFLAAAEREAARLRLQAADWAADAGEPEERPSPAERRRLAEQTRADPEAFGLVAVADDHGPDSSAGAGRGDSAEVIAAALVAAGLPILPCGLNADWCVRAWELGPADHVEANTTSGQLFLLDTEEPVDGCDRYGVVRRWHRPRSIEGDKIVSVTPRPLPLTEAVAAAARRLATIARRKGGAR